MLDVSSMCRNIWTNASLLYCLIIKKFPIFLVLSSRRKSLVQWVKLTTDIFRSSKLRWHLSTRPSSSNSIIPSLLVSTVSSHFRWDSCYCLLHPISPPQGKMLPCLVWGLVSLKVWHWKFSKQYLHVCYHSNILHFLNQQYMNS